MADKAPQYAYFTTESERLRVQSYHEGCDNHLVRIMQQLAHGPKSQHDLTQSLDLWASNLSVFMRNLIDLGLVEKMQLTPQHKKVVVEDLQLNSSHMSHKLMQLSSGYGYFFIIVHAENEFSLRLYQLSPFAGMGKDRRFTALHKPIHSAKLRLSKKLETTINNISKGINTALEKTGLSREQIKLVQLATKGTVEQGYSGLMYRNNVITGTNIPLATYLFSF